MTDEPKTRATPTRGYLSDTTTQVILRTAGNDSVVSLLDSDGATIIPTAIRERLAREMTIRLLVEGHSILAIAGGSGLPDRSLPTSKQKSTAPRALNRVKLAIANVRAVEMIRAEKAQGLKLGREDAQRRAEIEVRGFNEAEIEALSGLHAVKLEITRLAGGEQMTTEEALAAARARIGDGSVKPAVGEGQMEEIAAAVEQEAA